MIRNSIWIINFIKFCTCNVQVCNYYVYNVLLTELTLKKILNLFTKQIIKVYVIFNKFL